MAKFRKRPVVIEAEQWLPGKRIKGVIEVTLLSDPGIPRQYIQTLEGEMEVSPGDWIITGVKGERYPCKPDIFAMTYEAVDG